MGSTFCLFVVAVLKMREISIIAALLPPSSHSVFPEANYTFPPSMSMLTVSISIPISIFLEPVICLFHLRHRDLRWVSNDPVRGWAFINGYENISLYLILRVKSSTYPVDTTIAILRRPDTLGQDIENLFQILPQTLRMAWQYDFATVGIVAFE